MLKAPGSGAQLFQVETVQTCRERPGRIEAGGGGRGKGERRASKFFS